MVSSSKDSEKMEALGRMTRGLVHNFNNSLAAIMGYADFLTSDLTPGSEHHLFAENIKKAGLQLQEQLEQIRALAIERHQGKDITLNLVEILKNIVNGYQAHLPSGQSLIMTSDIDGATLTLPTNQADILFSNIIKNAIESLGNKEGKITVHISSNETPSQRIKSYRHELVATEPTETTLPMVRIEVSDTGVGIDEPILGKVLEPHFTTHAAETSHGMGLSVAQGIVKYLEGKLILSTTPSEGTCVSIILPVEEISAFSDIKKNNSQKKYNVLLVEDRDMVRHTVETMLSRNGHTVKATDNGYTALDILREDPNGFDFVLTDYTMPDINGEDLIEDIRSDFSCLPIIVMSGDEGHLKKLKNNFNDPHIFILPKPIERDELESIMARITI